MINYIIAAIPNGTSELIERVQSPHPGASIHDYVAAVNKNSVHVPVSDFFKRNVYLKQQLRLGILNHNNVIGPK